MLLTKSLAVESLRNAGIRKGDTILVHSALRPFGMIEGGKDTIVQALADAVGPEGTLIAPAFTFSHEKVDVATIDPLLDKSEMGAISESIRKLEGSVRTIAYRHSFSINGPLSEAFSTVDPSLPVFDLRSVFGKMLAYDTKVILLGLTYDSCTSFHFAEYLVKVPYRMLIEHRVLLRKPEGTLQSCTMMDYQPMDEDHTYDFNRAGRLLEEQGKVGISFAGNAVIRTFKLRDLIDLILVTYPLQNDIFFADATGHSAMALRHGVSVSTGNLLDGAGRLVETYWSCLNEAEMFKPDLHS